MSPLLETLAAQLARPREITPQVLEHLSGTYGLNREGLGDFLTAALPKLEDYEIDLILSPLFTPALKDQAVVAGLLGRESVPTTAWPGLVEQLASRPVHAQLVTEDQQQHSVLLRGVSIERWVYRLRLEAEVPESLFKLVAELPVGSDRSKLLAIARRAVWDTQARQEILRRYLTLAPGADAYRLEDAVELLKLVETYQPANLTELLALIPHWQQVLHQKISEAGGPKPFFNERVQDLHGGGRDQRRQDNRRLSALENERAILERLKRVLAG